MAWRPIAYLINGELDNTERGKVTGYMKFAGLEDKVTFDLEGDFHRDIRGAKIRLSGNGVEQEPYAKKYMEGFAQHQTGKVGDITAGLPPQDYISRPYVEFYGKYNGRVVLELQPDQVEVIGSPIPYIESDPVSRETQRENMTDFLKKLTDELGREKEE